MKKLVLTIAIFLLFVPTASFAQVNLSCSPITKQNKMYCCTGDANNPYQAACNAYNGGYASTSTQTTTQPQQVNTPQCTTIDTFNYNSCCKTFYRGQNLGKCSAYETVDGSTIGGSTPGVQVVNVTQYSSDSAQIADTPQSGSSTLKECSAIKFVSLLDILVWVKCIIVVAIIPLIFALALMFFLWGVMRFIAASDSAKKEEGKKFIMAGLIGLFVMTSLWGIINIVATTLGTGSAVPILQTSSLKKTP